MQALNSNGHAGPLFVQHLINELPRTWLQAGLVDVMGLLAEKENPLSDQEKRVARSFALAALAGELAIKWGILPWDVGCVKDAFIAIFKNWRANQPKSTQSKEHTQIIEKISDAIHSHGDARFPICTGRPQ